MLRLMVLGISKFRFFHDFSCSITLAVTLFDHTFGSYLLSVAKPPAVIFNVRKLLGQDILVAL